MDVSIRIPVGYSLPKIYESTDPNTVSLALTLGAEAYETLRGTAMKTARNESHTEAIEETRKEMDQQVLRIRQEKIKLQEAFTVAQARIEALEQSSAMTTARESFEELIRSKDTQIAQLQRTIDTHFGAVSGRIDTLQNSITKSFSSSKEKGAFGESFTESMLKKAFDCDIQAISKDANTSDIKMTRGPEQEYFWEVKNYTRMVSTEEVEKFRRDRTFVGAALSVCAQVLSAVAAEGTLTLNSPRTGASSSSLAISWPVRTSFFTCRLFGPSSRWWNSILSPPRRTRRRCGILRSRANSLQTCCGAMPHQSLSTGTLLSRTRSVRTPCFLNFRRI
jgi:hypothetical protein